MAHVPYEEKSLDSLQSQVCERIIAYLVNLKQNYKFVVNCSVLQKSNAQLVMACSTVQNPNEDEIINITWPKEKIKENLNRNLYCIVNIYQFSF